MTVTSERRGLKTFHGGYVRSFFSWHLSVLEVSESNKITFLEEFLGGQLPTKELSAHIRASFNKIK